MKLTKKINNDNINNSLANNMGAKTTTKITVIRTRETVSIVMRATATATSITIAAPKKTI